MDVGNTCNCFLMFSSRPGSFFPFKAVSIQGPASFPRPAKHSYWNVLLYEVPLGFQPSFLPMFPKLFHLLCLFLGQSSFAAHLSAKVDASGISVPVCSRACWFHVPHFILVALSKPSFVSNRALLKLAPKLWLIHPFWALRIVQRLHSKSLHWGMWAISGMLSSYWSSTTGCGETWWG